MSLPSVLQRVVVRKRPPRDAIERVPAILRAAGIDPDGARTEALAIDASDSVTFAVRPGNVPAYIVRLARSDPGIAGLRRAAAAQRALHAQPELSGPNDLASVIPTVLATGDSGPWAYTVETARPGRRLDDRHLVGEVVARGRITALAAVGSLHRATARSVAAETIRAAWIERRRALAADLLARRPGASRAALDTLVEAAGAGLTDGRSVRAGWIHGDLWAANILVDDRGLISGLVDWDSAEPDEEAGQDTLHLILFERRRRRHESLGQTVVSVLSTGWDASDRILLPEAGLDAGQEKGDTAEPAPDRSLVLRYWLRFLEANVTRHPELRTADGWLDQNLVAVLACA